MVGLSFPYFEWSLPDVPRALAAGPHSPPAFLSGDRVLAGWTALYRERRCMCVRACGRQVPVVDVVI